MLAEERDVGGGGGVLVGEMFKIVETWGGKNRGREVMAGLVGGVDLQWG